MVECECYNVKCRHKWDYRGHSKDKITCPKCQYKLRLEKAKLGYPVGLPTQPTQSIQREIEEIEPIEEVEEEIILPKDTHGNWNIANQRLLESEFDWQTYMDQFGNEFKMRQVKGIEILRTIPRDVGKRVQHPRSFG